MVKRHLALLCIALLLCPLSARTVQASPQPVNRISTLKQRLAEIPGGAIVEVKFHKQPKVRGRLGAVSDEGFEIQHLKNDKMLNQKLAFEDVKSVKVAGHGWSTGAKILVGALAGVGIVFVIAIVAYAVAGGS